MSKKPQLSKRQQIAIRRLGGEWVRGEPLTTVQTYRSLQSRGLVVNDFRSGTGGWHLTEDGHEALAALKAEAA